ncbi:hypothetical protein [Paenibacillus sp. LPE1-1-1.1]|uniref:hypothetical protein n=1 Tax=Paenibacillus sp. LPE1-1-1.1 TaxID=3135230 RepID=UPI003434FBB5
MPKNHGKPYTLTEKQLLDQIASGLTDKAHMYRKADTIAEQMERTIVAVCKQLELRRGWYWAAR